MKAYIILEQATHHATLTFFWRLRWCHSTQQLYWRCCRVVTYHQCVTACSDNNDDVIISHNSSASLTFNDSTAVAFQCLYQTPYNVPITYTWYVNGIRVNQLSSSYEHYFTEGVNVVTCESSYGMEHCPPCEKSTSLTVTIDRMSLWGLMCINKKLITLFCSKQM